MNYGVTFSLLWIVNDVLYIPFRLLKWGADGASSVIIAAVLAPLPRLQIIPAGVGQMSRKDQSMIDIQSQMITGRPKGTLRFCAGTPTRHDPAKIYCQGLQETTRGRDRGAAVTIPLPMPGLQARSDVAVGLQRRPRGPGQGSVSTAAVRR